MLWSISALIALMSGVFLLTFVYCFLYLHYREKYMLAWGISWLSYSMSYVFAFWYAAQMKSNVLISLNQISLLLSGLFLLDGTYRFIKTKMPKWWLYTALSGSIWIIVAIIYRFSIQALTTPTYVFLGGVYIWTGQVIFRSGVFGGLGKPITGTSFLIWGLYKLMLPFLGEESWLTPWGYLISWLAPWGFLISMVMTFTASIGILLAFFNRIGLELNESEKRFRLLAENARDIIYRLSLKPVLKIEYISPALTSILGYNPVDFYNDPKRVLRFVHPADRKRLLRMLTEPETRTETLRWVRKDGVLVWIEHNRVPVYDKNGSLVAIEGIARDITERKNAELAMLEARERVARAERMASLGTMAAAITHEINQPLNSLKVTADSMLFLYRRGEQPDIGEIMANIKDISDQAGRIDSIIRHMRSLIKRDIQEKLAPCNINTVVEDVIALLGAQLTTRNISIIKDLDEDLPLITAKATHLEQIIINLVFNSMKALDKVDRNNRKIICRTYKGNGCIILEIIDNGPGIREEIKSRIFEPFFSGDPMSDNMGLGLCIVQSIVKSYNGALEIYNNDTGGATVKIEFPCTENDKRSE